MSHSLRNLLLHATGQEVLRSVDLEKSEAFDCIAELAVLSTDFDAGFLAIFDGDEATVIGSHGFEKDVFTKTASSRALNRQILFLADMDKAAPNSPFVDGRLARAKTGLSAGLMLKDEFVGVLAVFSERRLATIAAEQSQIMIDLAEIAGEMIRSKASLKLLLGDLFSLANR